MGTTNILDLNNRLTKVEKGNVAQNSYTSLKNKPKINSVTLSGNKSLADIGAAAATDVGDLSVLTTTDKSSTVGAINELNSGLTNLVKKATVIGTTNENGILDVDISGRNNTNTAIIEVIGVRESPYFSEFYTITAGTTLTDHWVYKLEYVNGEKLVTQQVKIIVKYIEHN